MTQSRTHNCGELRLADAGKTVTLAGWLENMREVGSNLAFVVLRDFYGTTQVVIESEEMMQAFKPINRESTISVTGVVRERTSKNPKQPRVRSRSCRRASPCLAAAATMRCPSRSTARRRLTKISA